IYLCQPHHEIHCHCSHRPRPPDFSNCCVSAPRAPRRSAHPCLQCVPPRSRRFSLLPASHRRSGWTLCRWRDWILPSRRCRPLDRGNLLHTYVVFQRISNS
ncbi:hypothetical protein P691DRAFT_778970, partial [Macrolepiota fuliginosa MF-IS2]